MTANWRNALTLLRVTDNGRECSRKEGEAKNRKSHDAPKKKTGRLLPGCG